jgi:hypothetical protein
MASGVIIDLSGGRAQRRRPVVTRKKGWCLINSNQTQRFKFSGIASLKRILVCRRPTRSLRSHWTIYDSKPCRFNKHTLPSLALLPEHVLLSLAYLALPSDMMGWRDHTLHHVPSRQGCTVARNTRTLSRGRRDRSRGGSQSFGGESEVCLHKSVEASSS